MDTQPLIPFSPVPLRSRRDGWTPQRQRAFIALLAEGMPSNHAAVTVGLSKQTAHALRRRPGAESFSAAWDAAIAAARKARVAERARRFEAALHGVDEPVLYFGRTVGHVRRYDNRLLCRLIAAADRAERKARQAPAKPIPAPSSVTRRLARMVREVSFPRSPNLGQLPPVTPPTGRR
jgi:hypothetical protein